MIIYAKKIQKIWPLQVYLIFRLLEIGKWPKPSLLIVSDMGDILEISYHQKKFNGLPNLNMLPHKPHKNIYALEHQGAIYFLSTDEKLDVIKYDIVGKKHKRIHNNFPVASLDHCLNFETCTRTYGVRIMDHYWIILGQKDGGLRAETNLWSIKKEKWIAGPNFQAG